MGRAWVDILSERVALTTPRARFVGVFAGEGTGLDARTYALVKIAALIALDAPPTSYAWQIANALEGGVTPEEILGVLRAVAFQVGGPKVVAAAPEIMLALGLTLPEEA